MAVSEGNSGVSGDTPSEQGLFTLLSVGITIVAEGFVTHHPPCVPWCDVCYPLCDSCGLTHPKDNHSTASSQQEFQMGTDFGTKTTVLRVEE